MPHRAHVLRDRAPAHRAAHDPGRDHPPGAPQALDELLPYQRSDFDGLFPAMDGYPVIIRLIDPPLHEFMPDEEKLLEQVIEMRVKGETKGLKEKEDLLAAIRGMHESNPMMGLRGVRLSIYMPEIVEMQVRAIFEAAADETKKGVVVKPEVMIPLTGTVNELNGSSRAWCASPRPSWTRKAWTSTISSAR